MTIFDSIITSANVKKIWKRLKDTEVPIVSDLEYKNVNALTLRLLHDINRNQYVPSIGHGYLGYRKSIGVTRFVPILTKEDITVYYLIVLALQDYLISSIDGVYGGWLVIPKKVKQANEADVPSSTPEIIDPYFSNTFSKKEWFKNWTSFNEMLENLTANPTIGQYVATSDIANFYDTIDVTRLCNRISVVAAGHDELVDLLRFLLAYWDRRIKRYAQSTKGIPQEIISDASRILANFFLNEFDIKFKQYCDAENLTYARWADDILIFGNSKPKLESAIYRASQILLSIGLNLNASKSRIYARKEYRLHRAIDVLEAVRAKDIPKYNRSLRAFESYRRNHDARVDSAYRASISFAFSERKALSPFVANFIHELSQEYEYLSLLSPSLYRKKFHLAGATLTTINRDVQILCRKPYTAAKASYLLFIRKYYPELRRLGLSKRAATGLVHQIANSSSDSTLLTDFCVPETLKRIT